MKVTLNGQPKEISGSATLKNLVEQFCKDSSRIITELNGDIVKFTQWPDTQVKDGDTIELVNFVGGG